MQLILDSVVKNSQQITWKTKKWMKGDTLDSRKSGGHVKFKKIHTRLKYNIQGWMLRWRWHPNSFYENEGSGYYSRQEWCAEKICRLDETQTQVSEAKDQVLHMDLGGSYRDVTLVATNCAIHWFFTRLWMICFSYIKTFYLKREKNNSEHDHGP